MESETNKYYPFPTGLFCTPIAAALFTGAMTEFAALLPRFIAFNGKISLLINFFLYVVLFSGPLWVYRRFLCAAVLAICAGVLIGIDELRWVVLRNFQVGSYEVVAIPHLFSWGILTGIFIYREYGRYGNWKGYVGMGVVGTLPSYILHLAYPLISDPRQGVLPHLIPVYYFMEAIGVIARVTIPACWAEYQIRKKYVNHT